MRVARLAAVAMATALAMHGFLAPAQAEQPTPQAAASVSEPASNAAAAPAVLPNIINAGAGSATPVAATPSDASPAPVPTTGDQPAPAAPAIAPAGAPTSGSPDSAATTPEVPAPQAAAEPAPPPEPTLMVDIDLSSQRLTVSENGQVRSTWPISSARSGYRTPTGTFTPVWMSAMWYSRQYDWAPMPHAIFFHHGVAIHATYATGMLGRPASHGCVRLSPGNAATLYKLVGKHTRALTRIVVHGTPRGGVGVAYEDGGGRSRYNSRRSGYYSSYSYYAPPPDYYYAPPRRRGTGAYGYYPKPRRYVSRGIFQYGY